MQEALLQDSDIALANLANFDGQSKITLWVRIRMRLKPMQLLANMARRKCALTENCRSLIVCKCANVLLIMCAQKNLDGAVEYLLLAKDLHLRRLLACCSVFLADNFDKLLCSKPKLVQMLGRASLLRVLQVTSAEGSAQRITFQCRKNYPHVTVTVRRDAQECPKCQCAIADIKDHYRDHGLKLAPVFPSPATLYHSGALAPIPLDVARCAPSNPDARLDLLCEFFFACMLFAACNTTWQHEASCARC